MRRSLTTLILLLATTAMALAVPAANQVVDFTTLVANQPGNYSWISSAPAGNHQAITYGQYKSYVVNQTTSCSVSNNNQVMTWADVIACAVSHIPSQQSESANGSYQTVSYSATFNSTTGLFTCHGPIGANGYTGTPIVLPTGTVAPTSSNPITLNLTSITYPGSSSITVTLKDPSGNMQFTQTTSSHTFNHSQISGPAGAWSWVITQTGGTVGACDSTDGVTSTGGTQVQWVGQVFWYQ